MSSNLELLREAAELFRTYEKSHLSRGQGHEEKARRNADIATRIEQALASQTAKPLTHEQIDAIAINTALAEVAVFRRLVRAVEHAHGINENSVIKQRTRGCYVCNKPIEESSLYLPSKDPNGGDLGPLCHACYDDRCPPRAPSAQRLTEAQLDELINSIVNRHSYHDERIKRRQLARDVENQCAALWGVKLTDASKLA